MRDFDLNVAIDYLKIDGEKEKNALKEKLQSVARDYWELRQDIVDRPPAAWYRDKLNAVEKAAKDLLSLLKEDSGTALATLESTFARQLNWQLRRRSLAPNAHPSAPNRQPSLEEILEWVLIGCGRSVIKTRGGARKQNHMRTAVSGLVDIWCKFSKKPFPLNLQTHPEETRSNGQDAAKNETEKYVFTAPASYFVQLVMECIDPKVTLAEIATALRANRTPRVQKPRSKSR